MYGPPKFLSIFVLSVLACGASAQQPSAYPSKGQTSQKKAQDDVACQAWAKSDTGIDPAVIAAAPVTTIGPQFERVRGAVRGAAAGAVIGDSSRAAKQGATVGVVSGGAQSRRNQAAQAQNAQATKAQTLNIYWRAWGACMTGRGYSVQ